MNVFSFLILHHPFQRKFTFILLFAFFTHQLAAQQVLLDSLTLDTLMPFTSIQEALKTPDQVIKLELRKKGLRSFPKEILQFKNLQYLDLSKNKITELPEEIGQLKSLQYFSVARNNLVEFPFQIGELTNLYYLNANNNDLVGITTGVGTLTKLRNFDLWSNDLEHFPDELQNLKELKILDLRAILIPDAEQTRIQELLPAATIYFSPYCKCGQ